MSDQPLTIEAIEQEVADHRTKYPQSKIGYTIGDAAKNLEKLHGLDVLPELQGVLRENMYFEELVFRDKVPWERAMYLTQQKFRPGTMSVVTPPKGSAYCAACKHPLPDITKTAHDCPGWQDTDAPA